MRWRDSQLRLRLHQGDILKRSAQGHRLATLNLVKTFIEKYKNKSIEKGFIFAFFNELKMVRFHYSEMKCIFFVLQWTLPFLRRTMRPWSRCTPYVTDRQAPHFPGRKIWDGSTDFHLTKKALILKKRRRWQWDWRVMRWAVFSHHVFEIVLRMRMIQISAPSSRSMK